MINKQSRIGFLHLAVAAYYLALAIILVTLLLAKVVRGANWFLGTIIFVSSIPEIMLYFIDNKYSHKNTIFSLFIAIFGMIAGLCFILIPSISTSHICLVWGVLDIISGLIQLIDSFIEFKENKLVIAKSIIGLLTVAVGILLCIELEDGIIFHLTALGLSIGLLAIYEIVQFILIKRGL